MNINNFHSVSEYPDIKVPVEQVKRLNERYNFAKKFSKNKNVLEIGCGSGQGSKLINSVAKKYTGIDVDEKLLEIAKLNNPNLEFLKDGDKIEMEIENLGILKNSVKMIKNS